MSCKSNIYMYISMIIFIFHILLFSSLTLIHFSQRSFIYAQLYMASNCCNIYTVFVKQKHYRDESCCPMAVSTPDVYMSDVNVCYNIYSQSYVTFTGSVMDSIAEWTVHTIFLYIYCIILLPKCMLSYLWNCFWKAHIHIW